MGVLAKVRGLGQSPATKSEKFVLNTLSIQNMIYVQVNKSFHQKQYKEHATSLMRPMNLSSTEYVPETWCLGNGGHKAKCQQLKVRAVCC
jgi:hypothetical protein